MDNWFTIEKIDDSSFAISEYKHWEETHCYLLCGTEKALLIDSRLGIANIKNVVDSFTSLPIIVATTHAHWDHIGGHKYFDTIAVHEMEREWLSAKFPLPLQLVKNNLICKLCDFPSDFKISDYQIYQGEPQILLHDGDCIDLGERKISVIHTPGHSPGHCCYYEPQREYLYSGDLIYRGCLDAFYPTTDPLLFWKSIQKILPLKTMKLLPGHHKLNITISIISQIENAFHELHDAGKWKQGNGIFDYGEIQIHI